MPRIRIVDIARMANVSPGTVDRVIHNRVGVSDETRILIENIIKESGYQKDILARALASNKTYRILVCMPSVVYEHAFWKLPEKGVNRARWELQHFNIEIEYLRFDQHEKSDFHKKSARIHPNNYDGLLFAPVFRDESMEFLRRFKSANRFVVLFNSYLDSDLSDGFIGQDAFQSGYLGGRLMSYGLPRGKDVIIVNLSMRRDHYDHIIEREKGFKSYFEEHGDRVNNLISLDLNGGEFPEISEEMDKYMSDYNVAGVFVTNSRVHLLGRYLSEKGAMNLRLIGYDLLEQSIDYLKREYIDFLISQSPEEQAYMGIRSLFEMMVLEKDGPGKVMLPIDILTKENIDYYLKFNAQYEQPE